MHSYSVNQIKLQRMYLKLHDEMGEVEFSLKIQSDADVLLTCEEHAKIWYEPMTVSLVRAVDPDTDFWL